VENHNKNGNSSHRAHKMYNIIHSPAHRIAELHPPEKLIISSAAFFLSLERNDQTLY